LATHPAQYNGTASLTETMRKWWPGADQFAKRTKTAKLPEGRESARADSSQSNRAWKANDVIVWQPGPSLQDTRIFSLLV